MKGDIIWYGWILVSKINSKGVTESSNKIKVCFTDERVTELSFLARCAIDAKLLPKSKVVDFRNIDPTLPKQFKLEVLEGKEKCGEVL